MPCTLPASLADAAVCRGSFHAVLGGEAPVRPFLPTFPLRCKKHRRRAES